MKKDVIPHSKPWITEADQQALQRQLASGQVARGQVVKQFEERVGGCSGFKYTMATPSGTAALALILWCLGISPGDQIILPSYVCHSVETAVRFVGAKPVFCDVNGPWRVTPMDIVKKITKNTRGVILVHTFGIDASDKAFADLGVPIIEDYCQAFGLRPQHETGSGLAFFSFNGTKCLTTGEGGMAGFNDKALFKKAQNLKADNCHLTVMSDLQAALGISQLDRYPEMLRKRRNLAQTYLKLLPEKILAKTRGIASSSIHFRFPVTFAGEIEETIEQAERMEGVSLRRGVDALLHRMNGMSDEEFPGACSLFKSTLSLPIYPCLSKFDQERVIDYIKRRC